MSVDLDGANEIWTYCMYIGYIDSERVEGCIMSDNQEMKGTVGNHDFIGLGIVWTNHC